MPRCGNLVVVCRKLCLHMYIHSMFRDLTWSMDIINIPSSLVATESTLVFTYPAELIPCIIVEDVYCSWQKIESQSRLEPGISEFQSDTLTELLKL